MESRASGHRDLDSGLSNASECYDLISCEAIRYRARTLGTPYRPYKTCVQDRTVVAARA
jgi:hypothetical protein